MSPSASYEAGAIEDDLRPRADDALRARHRYRRPIDMKEAGLGPAAAGEGAAIVGDDRHVIMARTLETPDEGAHTARLAGIAPALVGRLRARRLDDQGDILADAGCDRQIDFGRGRRADDQLLLHRRGGVLDAGLVGDRQAKLVDAGGLEAVVDEDAGRRLAIAEIPVVERDRSVRDRASRPASRSNFLALRDAFGRRDHRDGRGIDVHDMRCRSRAGRSESWNCSRPSG